MTVTAELDSIADAGLVCREDAMDQDRRAFLKSAGCVTAATLAATMAAPTSAAAETSGAGGKLNELNQLDATELAARIAGRKISPVEVIDAALARLEATQPALTQLSQLAV
jgi:hypothetical protein